MALTRHCSAQSDLFSAQPYLFFLGARPACGSAPSRTDTSTARQRWRLTFPDRNPVSVIVWPSATRAEVMAQWPSALSATPADLGHTERAGPPERSHSRVMRTPASR